MLSVIRLLCKGVLNFKNEKALQTFPQCNIQMMVTIFNEQLPSSLFLFKYVINDFAQYENKFKVVVST